MERQKQADLVTRLARSRDRDAFLDLYDHFGPRLKSYAQRLGAEAALAEELVQETMIVVWRQAQLFNPDKASVSTWLYTILRNKRIDTIRRDSRRAYEPDPTSPVQEEGPEENYQLAVRASGVHQALKELPESQAIVINKAFLEDMTHTTIAEELGLPLGTVKSRIRLALERLRRVMEA